MGNIKAFAFTKLHAAHHAVYVTQHLSFDVRDTGRYQRSNTKPAYEKHAALPSAPVSLFLFAVEDQLMVQQ